MGGIPPLGYEPDGRSLKIVEHHAELIRMLFRRYLDTGNVRLLAEQLRVEGVRLPGRVLSTGRRIGGGLLTRGQIYKTLANPTYVGEVHHRGQVYEGKHNAVIARAEWDAVQAKLRDNVQGTQRYSTAKARSLLAGKVFDDAGEPLVASHACKGKVRYRYYVSRKLQHNAAARDEGGLRMPALELEKAVALRLAQAVGDPLKMTTALALVPAPEQLQAAFGAADKLPERLRHREHGLVRALIERVEIGPSVVRITADACAVAAKMGLSEPKPEHSQLILELPYRLTRRGQALRIVKADGGIGAHTDRDDALVNLLVMAQRWWKRLEEGSLTVAQLGRAENVSPAWITKVVRLQFLAPDLVRVILAGTQPPQISAAAVTRSGTLPVDWAEQRSFFGLA